MTTSGSGGWCDLRNLGLTVDIADDPRDVATARQESVLVCRPQECLLIVIFERGLSTV